MDYLNKMEKNMFQNAYELSIQVGDKKNEEFNSV